MTITEENFVERAEKAIKELIEMKNPKTGHVEPRVTTSQIRNLLAMSADIYNDVILLREDRLPESICGRIQYLKVRMIYEAGRTSEVRRLVENANLLKIVDEIQGRRKNYLLYSRYMEALVAYHKFYKGKD